MTEMRETELMRPINISSVKSDLLFTNDCSFQQPELLCAVVVVVGLVSSSLMLCCCCGGHAAVVVAWSRNMSPFIRTISMSLLYNYCTIVPFSQNWWPEGIFISTIKRSDHFKTYRFLTPMTMCKVSRVLIDTWRDFAWLKVNSVIHLSVPKWDIVHVIPGFGCLHTHRYLLWLRIKYLKHWLSGLCPLCCV